MDINVEIIERNCIVRVYEVFSKNNKLLKMKNAVKIASFVLMLGFLVAGCGKYPDGPGLSLKTKKGRLAGKWKIEKYIDSSGVESFPTSDVFYTFERDETYQATEQGLTVNGTWEFVDSKESLKRSFTLSNVNFSSTDKILRLTNKELWLEDEDGDKTYYTAE